VTSQANLFFRQDTLFGACQGLADDLGINALWLRVPLAASILYDPAVAAGIYAVLCVVVFATRMIWPVKAAKIATAAAVPAAAEVEAAPAAAVAADNEQRELAHAA